MTPPSSTRAGTARALLAAAVVAVAVCGCATGQSQQVSCGSHQAILLLAAQAVPSATLIPCIKSLPGGWSYGGSEIRSGLVRFWLDSDRAGAHAVELRLTRACDVAGTIQLPPSTSGAPVRRYEEPTARQPQATVRYYLFTGGCARYRFSFTRQTAPALVDQADQLLGFTPRSVDVNSVRENLGVTLCGAEAPPCPG
jgi:hypothetical protein